MRSHSGFSGSPVFLLIPANTFRGQFGGVENDNTTRFRLLGIDTGHLHHHESIEERRVDNTWSERPDLRVAYNTDIAIVAPISQVVRLLEREDRVAERRRHDDEAEPGHEWAK